MLVEKEQVIQLIKRYPLLGDRDRTELISIIDQLPNIGTLITKQNFFCQLISKGACEDQCISCYRHQLLISESEKFTNHDNYKE